MPKKCIPVLVLTLDDLLPEDVRTIPLTNIELSTFRPSREELYRAHLVLLQQSKSAFKVHKDATGLFPRGAVLRLEQEV